MGKLWLVTGVGHCGTTWMGHALNHPSRGLYAVHEGMKVWSPRGGKPWKDGTLHLLKYGIDGYFDYWFTMVRKLLATYPVVVDSHSWIPAVVEEVAQRIEVAGVIHLVRNGIQNVHSLYVTDHGPPQFWFGKVIAREARYFGWNLPRNASLWEYWCRWWASNMLVVDKLKTIVPVVTLQKLEDLQAPANLANLAELLGVPIPPDAFQGRVRRDLNRHVSGDRSTKALWKKWTPEQRKAFSKVCGATMHQLNYEMPRWARGGGD